MATYGEFRVILGEREKKARLQILLELQERFTAEKNQALVGSNTPVLVEGFSKRKPADCLAETPDLKGIHGTGIQWTGRTSGNKVVNFMHEDDHDFRNKLLTGEMVHVTIEHAFSHSLWGKPIRVERRR